MISRLYKAIKYWLLVRDANLTLRIERRRLVRRDEPIFQDTQRIQPVNSYKNHLKPHVFESYNNVINTAISWSFLGSANITEALQKPLSSIFYKKSAGEQAVNFKWVESLSASQSKRPENYFKWQNFFEFGQFAYQEHLRSYRTLETEAEWQAHYDELVEFFEYLVKKRSKIHAFCYQSWCDRYYIMNSGVSRRAAACAYMAKKADPLFDREVIFPVEEEIIDWDAINSIEKLADTYIILAQRQFHKDMYKLIEQWYAPLGQSKLYYCRHKNEELGFCVYFLLKDELIGKAISPTYEKSLYQACIIQRDRLKQKLDNLSQQGFTISLPDFIQLISGIWKAHKLSP